MKTRSHRPPHGDVAEWLGRGLQNLVPRFNSGRRLSGLGRLMQVPNGPLAQGESASLTRKRSLVQIQHGPQPETPLPERGFWFSGALGRPEASVEQPSVRTWLDHWEVAACSTSFCV